MRKGAMLALLICAPAFAQETLVEGVTVDSSTGRPIAGVHVRVFTFNASMNAKTYGAMSDSAGRFSIAKIPAGSYFYIGERAGYLTLRKAGGGSVPFPALILKPGERLTDFKLQLTPRATISGRVLDEYGDPVQNVQVQMTPVSPDAPVAFSMTGSMAHTDDRGEYRMPAGPGKYRLMATVTRMGNQAEVRTDGTSRADYAPTWYPDAASLDRASPVEVAAGDERNGVDIRLSLRNAGAPSGVEGTVTGIPDPPGWATVHLVSRDSANRSTSQQMVQTSREGRFSFRNPRPGNSRLFARYTYEGKALTSQIVELTDAAPPSDIVLRLAPAPDLTGTLAFDGEVPEAKRSVQLRPVDASIGSTRSGDTEAGNAFRVAGVFPGRYWVAVQPLPENAYVRAVELDGAPAEPDDLDLSKGGSRLKITIGRSAAQVSGSVVDKDGARLQNTLGSVLLLSDRGKLEFLDEERIARFEPDGSYRFKGLRPGKYWLLAVDAFRSGFFSSPEQLKKFAALAEEVELKEGDRLRKDLKIVTQEAVDAK
jgi:hypothetical protein